MTHISQSTLKSHFRLLLSGSVCENTYLTRFSCNSITVCSSSAYFCNFATFKMADFLPVKKKHLHLEIVWHFVEIFISPIATLCQRIKYAAFVCAFLDIWKTFIEKTPELQISKNFIKRECFYDTLLSCHAAVIMICYKRENFKDQESLLEQMGSDRCENFFSCNGQWLGNRHAYSFGDMSSNVSNMMRLQSIQVDEDAPNWAKAHLKQENVWSKQFQTIDNPVDLKRYPKSGEETDAWKEGVRLAQERAVKVGMSPAHLISLNGDPKNENDPEIEWFNHPLRETDIKKVGEDMASDEDLFAGLFFLNHDILKNICIQTIS